MSKRKEMPRPFLKWVGSKQNLLGEIVKRLPSGSFDYYEPFLGGGAVFFELERLGRIKTAVLNDACPELMTTYSSVRDNPHELMKMLDAMKPRVKDADFYYKLRNEADQAKMSMEQIATRFIFINKTGFNGLWRVNKAGRCNVPMGNVGKPALYDAENLLACSKALVRAHLFVDDFEDLFREVPLRNPERCVVYFDPPYVPVSATASFDDYRGGGFSLDDQKRLAALFNRCVDAGAHCLLSNSPPARSLYLGYGHTIDIVRAPRAINSDASKRGPVDELLIVGRKGASQ